MQIRLRTFLAASVLAGVLGAAGPAPSDTATAPPPSTQAPTTQDQSAGQSFSNAWTDLKSSADNAWQGLKHGTNAAVHGVKKGWQATKDSASSPSHD